MALTVDVTFRVPASVARALDKLAAAQGTSRANYLRELINDHVLSFTSLPKELSDEADRDNADSGVEVNQEYSESKIMSELGLTADDMDNFWWFVKNKCAGNVEVAMKNLRNAINPAAVLQWRRNKDEN